MEVLVVGTYFCFVRIMIMILIDARVPLCAHNDDVHVGKLFTACTCTHASYRSLSRECNSRRPHHHVYHAHTAIEIDSVGTSWRVHCVAGRVGDVNSNLDSCAMLEIVDEITTHMLSWFLRANGQAARRHVEDGKVLTLPAADVDAMIDCMPKRQ